MATLLLSAAGAALGGVVGGALGGGAAGLGAVALGRAAGAVAGSLIDQQILGAGGRAVATPSLDALRVQGAREGAPVAMAFGRVRISGAVIWASRFRTVTTSRRVGPKGAGGRVSERSVTVGLAIGLCEGPIERIGRIWADGKLLNLRDVSMRAHRGDEDQLPDPLIAAVEGPEAAPAYRGLAYLVFEEFDLVPYGERVPQFSVEVFRAPKVERGVGRAFPPAVRDLVEAVALSPGSGEATLATEIVRRRLDPGVSVSENVNSVDGRPDLLVALDQLVEAAPDCRSVSLVATWFGDDLRCGRCALAPAVEEREKRTEPRDWSVSGVGRAEARLVGRDGEGRPIFGGTPSDASVLQAIAELKRRGLKVMFYPFILMDIPQGSGLPDPYGDGEQPAYPWRGRITLDAAPGRPGSADQTEAAAAEVAAFFGQAQVADFAATEHGVAYAGPPEWSLRRFVLHYAHLCALAGGLDAFCIGSELRGLTTIRSARARYPAVEALKALARDVRAILGPEVRLTYAADWSEYFGHHPQDGSGDAIFHLDPLWADPAIDAVGIDNYMPLTDWRDGRAHLDAAETPSIFDLAYLQSRIEGGEGFDWFYATEEDRLAQVRTPIRDGAHGEDWMFRFKDIRSWWGNAHHDRIGGVRDASPTEWRPAGKPIWFTEIGCAAIDKGANQPNLFIDPKSSESGAPAFSSGAHDDHMQMRFLQAVLGYWRDPENNPEADLYPGRMVETAASHVWTWDARPWPDFPERLDVWSDGSNHALGHWMTGRLGSADLAEVVSEICGAAALTEIDVSELQGTVTGYAFPAGVTARQALQPLMLAYGFDAMESVGRVRFAMRPAQSFAVLNAEECVAPLGSAAEDAPIRLIRGAARDAPAAVRLSYPDASAEYEIATVEARDPAAVAGRVESVETSVVLEGTLARALAERWLADAGAGEERLECVLPPSALALEPGDAIALDDVVYRLDAISERGRRDVVAVRSGDDASPSIATAAPERRKPPTAPLREPPEVVGFECPELFGETETNSLLIAAFGAPWPGEMAVYLGDEDGGWSFAETLWRPAIMGELVAPLEAATPGRLAPGPQAEVRLFGGALESASLARMLAGGNLAAILPPGESVWELTQFARAELVGLQRYRLSDMLRGQAGTEAAALRRAPVGSRFLLLDAAVQRLPVPEALRGAELTLRIGPAHLRVDDPAFVEIGAVIAGSSRAPLPPAQLRGDIAADGILRANWLPRSRSDADRWLDCDDAATPTAAAYRVRVWRGGALALETATTSADVAWSPEPALQSGEVCEIGVAEVSPRRIVGAESRVVIHV